MSSSVMAGESEAAQKVVVFIEALKKIATEQPNKPNFEPALEEALDWDKMINNVLILPRIRAKGNDVRKTAITNFKETFKPIFKVYLIEKYGRPTDNISKLTTTKIMNSSISETENNNQIVVSVPLAGENQTIINTQWRVNKEGDKKIFDVSLEGISLTTTERDMVSDCFNKTYQNKPENFQAALDAIKAAFEQQAQTNNS